MSATPTTKKKGKKRKISQHVAESRSAEITQTAKNGGATNKKKKSKKSKSVKSIVDVEKYLVSWQNDKQGGSKGSWKFNKNTQSWLIRHMYESDKVSKIQFQILLSYLEGLQGDETKTRIVAEATMRALRYKEFEKKADSIKDDSKEEETADKSKGGKVEASENADDDAVEQKRWDMLDSHDKRKEYKRARKILETVK